MRRYVATSATAVARSPGPQPPSIALNTTAQIKTGTTNSPPNQTKRKVETKTDRTAIAYARTGGRSFGQLLQMSARLAIFEPTRPAASFVMLAPFWARD